jgi:hypothetical protein
MPQPQDWGALLDQPAQGPRSPAGRSKGTEPPLVAADSARLGSAPHARASATSRASRSAVERGATSAGRTGGAAPPAISCSRERGSGVHMTPQRQQTSSWPAIGAWQEWQRRGVWRLRTAQRSPVSPVDASRAEAAPERSCVAARPASGSEANEPHCGSMAGSRRGSPRLLWKTRTLLETRSAALCSCRRGWRSCCVAVAMADRLSALLTKHRLGSEKSWGAHRAHPG